MGIDVRALLERAGRVPSKALGQNFVTDPNTCERIVRIAGIESDSAVVEIGAGLGSLTYALAQNGASVLAVEIDRYLAPLLREVVEPFPNVSVICADALTLDWGEVLEKERTYQLVANLPYNVSVPLLMELFENVPQIVGGVVMVQKEVGERLAAKPNSEHYGAVSVRAAYFATLSIAGNVSANVFHPRPRVDSVLVRFVRHEPFVDPALLSYERLAMVINAGFAHRRKMLRRSLFGVIDDEAFVHAGVTPTQRAETVGLREWGALAAWPQQLIEKETTL